MRLNKLTAKQVASARPHQPGDLRKTGKKKGLPYQGGEPKMYGDGGGLQLVVSGQLGNINHKFTLRFRWLGKPNECGMGGFGTTIDEARVKAAEARRMVRAGINPIEVKRVARANRFVSPLALALSVPCGGEPFGLYGTQENFIRSMKNGDRA